MINMLEFDGDEGKLTVNPLWIVSVQPMSDERTRFTVAKRIENATVVETESHTITMPYHEFMEMLMRVSPLKQQEHQKLTLG